jgi:lipid-A-disaccharide synthase
MGVDAPDFSFGLEKKLKQAGIKTIHVVCPSIWAWRPNRVHELKKVADHVLCLFPFEPALLKPHGIEATFIGHPLASKVDLYPDKNKARLSLGLANDAPIVAVLPGSRQSEINLIGPIFLQAVALLHQKRPHLQFILPCAPGRRETIEKQLKELNLEKVVQLFDGQSHTVLYGHIRGGSI